MLPASHTASNFRAKRRRSNLSTVPLMHSRAFITKPRMPSSRSGSESGSPTSRSAIPARWPDMCELAMDPRPRSLAIASAARLSSPGSSSRVPSRIAPSFPWPGRLPRRDCSARPCGPTATSRISPDASSSATCSTVTAATWPISTDWSSPRRNRSTWPTGGEPPHLARGDGPRRGAGRMGQAQRPRSGRHGAMDEADQESTRVAVADQQ